MSSGEQATSSNEVQYRPLLLAGKQVLNRWAVTDLIEEPIEFSPVTMSGEVNDWLTKGFAIHENPARREVASLRRGNPPVFPSAALPALPGRSFNFYGREVGWNLDFPWENPRLERSGFWFTPTRLRALAATTVIAAEESTAPFELATCGSVSIWLNGAALLDFAPLTRNAEKRTRVELPLRKGRNEIVVHSEDIAERDTLYYFQLAYTGTQELTLSLPTGDTPPEKLLELENALQSAAFPASTVGDDPVRLILANPFDVPVSVGVSRGRLLGDSRSKSVELPANGSSLVIGSIDELGVGYAYFTISLTLGKLRLSRRLGVELYPSGELRRANEAAKTAEGRKAYVLRMVAERGGGNSHTALARLASGAGWDEKTVELVRASIAGVNARRDCSDFYLVALIRIWREYAGDRECPADLRDSLRRCILDFRYWIDEPGSDVMWFFSENHALLFHTCELLAGTSFPDEEFSNAGRTGREHAELARERLDAWFLRVREEGFAEWNSSAYLPIDSIGLFALRDMAAGERAAKMAEDGLYLLFLYLGLQSFKGILATSFGRTYEEELVGHLSAGTSAMNWTASGIGYPSTDSLATVFFALSSYLPPKEIESSSRLRPSSGRVVRFQQGKGGYARVYTYRTSAYCMSSVQDYRPGKPGYQEHVFHLALSPTAHVWVNHPGEMVRHGSGRPSYWAGNGILPKVAQYAGTAILIYQLPDEAEVSVTHARWPFDAFDEVVRVEDWLIGRVGEAYVGLACPGHLAEDETGSGGEIRVDGRRSAWIVRAGTRSVYKTLDEFVASTPAVGFDPGTLEVALHEERYGLLQLSWDAPLTLDCKEVEFGEPGIEGTLQDISPE